jgi:hypothetical protein
MWWIRGFVTSPIRDKDGASASPIGDSCGAGRMESTISARRLDVGCMLVQLTTTKVLRASNGDIFVVGCRTARHGTGGTIDLGN